MTAPNTTLRAIRMSMMLSQDDFAERLRTAGARDASKRLVQRWEAGVIAAPRPAYARALEVVTGLPIEDLGFAMPGMAPATAEAVEGDADSESLAPANGRGNHSGIWLSRYEYPSSGRNGTFEGRHFVLLLHHADRLTVRSLPDTAAGELTMDLTVDGNVVTGTWVEVTNRAGYYRGARYHGVVQMLAEPTGRRIAGKWLGFGRDMDVNVGPWELVFQDPRTTKTALEEYNRRPDIEGS